MKIRNMTRCAVLAALMAVCAWISVPLGNQAVSLQTFAVFLTLGLLGGKGGTATVLVYLLLGAAGLPVFTGFRGGIGALLGPTGGYLWGFLASCLLYWVLENRLPHWIVMVLSLLLCYACGTAWYFFLYASGASVWAILGTCVVPYLVPDGIKLFLALTLTKRLKALMV
ncbi:MAG: biotin transporter BioY [Oscillospiraceae bacterium]|nr:biotin transporter BioY [Oscillospiraceae bacterium]